MKDTDVIASFNNAWSALCQQYRNYPNKSTQDALNFLAKIIGHVNSEVIESHQEKQITLEEWLEWINSDLD